MEHPARTHFVPSSVRALSPLLAIAVLSALIAGCSSGTSAASSTTPSGTDPSAAVSSADPAASSAPQPSSSSAPAQPAPSATPPAVSGSRFKDGTYSAVGTYDSPGGMEDINVSLTLHNGVITDATFQGNSQGGISQMMQSNFAAGYKDQVIGKPIASLSLGVVNGSSLTSQGFMDAVQKIETQAAG